MIKSEFLEDDKFSNLTLDLENEKIERITEDTKTNMAIFKHSVDIEKKVNKNSTYMENKVNKLNDEIQDKVGKHTIDMENKVNKLNDDIQDKVGKHTVDMENKVNKLNDDIQDKVGKHTVDMENKVNKLNDEIQDKVGKHTVDMENKVNKLNDEIQDKVGKHTVDMENKVNKFNIEIQDKVDKYSTNLEKRVNDISNKIENIEDNTKTEIQNSIFYLSKQLDDINKKLNETDFANYNKKINTEVTKIENSFNEDEKIFIENKNKIKILEKEIEDYSNKVLIEEKKLQQNKDVETELINDMLVNKKNELKDIINVISSEVVKNEDNIKIFRKTLSNKETELLKLNRSFDENERKKHLIDLSNLMIDYNNLNSSYISIKNDYDKNYLNINERINFNNNLMRSFDNIELSPDNSYKLEKIKDDFSSLISEFELEKLFSSQTFDDIHKLSLEANSINIEDFDDLNDLIISKNKFQSYRENFSNFLKKSNKYSQNNEKVYSELLKITINLENLFQNSINQIKSDKNLENKIKDNLDKKYDAKSNESLDLMKELKNEVLSLISNNKNSELLNLNSTKIDSKLLNNISIEEKINKYPVLILNSKKINEEILELDFAEIENLSDTKLLDSIKVNDENYNKNFVKKSEVQNIMFSDYKDGELIESQIVGKIVKGTYYYKDFPILGDGLKSIHLYDNKNNKKSIQTSLERILTFDQVDIISKIEASEIISDIYNVKDFELSFCYYCNHNSNFILPAYQVDFKEGNFINTFFPANLKYLPILKISQISIKKVEGLTISVKDNNDPDNIGNDFENNKLLIFDLQFNDFTYTGDSVEVYSVYKIENFIKEDGLIRLYIPSILQKNKFNNLGKIELIITCKNKFGFSNCLKFFIDLSKYVKMFSIEKSISHGGNRHNFAINNFDTITGSQMFDKFRNDMISSGIHEEYCNLTPSLINGNADFVLNIAGGPYTHDLIENLDDVEHIIMVGKSNFNDESISEIFKKKVHLISGFEKNISINNMLNDFYKKSYKDGQSLVNSWITSSIINNSSDKSPFLLGPLISKPGSKYNSIKSSEDKLYRAYVKDTVWGKVPGPGLDLFHSYVEGYWKLSIE